MVLRLVFIPGANWTHPGGGVEPLPLDVGRREYSGIPVPPDEGDDQMTFHHLETRDGILLIGIVLRASPAGFSAASVARIIRIIIGIDIGILHEKSEDRVMIAQSASDAAEALIVDATLLQMFDVPVDTGPEGIIGILLCVHAIDIIPIILLIEDVPVLRIGSVEAIDDHLLDDVHGFVEVLGRGAAPVVPDALLRIRMGEDESQQVLVRDQGVEHSHDLLREDVDEVHVVVAFVVCSFLDSVRSILDL